MHGDEVVVRLPGGGLFYHCRMRLIPGVLLGSAVLAGSGLVQAVAAQPAAPASPTTAAASLAAGSPEWIVDRFFVQKEFPELERYATGEFAELYEGSATLGSIVPANVTVTSRILERDAAHAIFNISMTDSNVTKEWYAYLRVDAGMWKVEAIRTLMLPAKFFETILAVERAAVAGRLNELGVQELDRSHLTIASDAELKAHFISQQPLFAALAKDFAALSSIDVVNFDGKVAPEGGATAEQAVGLAQQLRSLRLGAAIRKYRDCEGCVVLLIGGDGANQVGYLHAPPGARVPKMSPQSFIYVEAIASDWYLFKTV